MKTHFKKMLALSLAVVLCCLFLCACGISEEKAVGTWSGSYIYNGNSFSVSFVLEPNGEYSEVVYKNGSLSSTEDGTWEIKGGKVIMHEDGNMGSSTVYEYRGGALINNNHEFTKE